MLSALQVLGVVLIQVEDARTLLLCSMLSTHFHGLVQQAVQQRLPELVAACSFQNGSSNNCAVKWLCRLAGHATVNTHAAGCAVLDKVMQMPEEAAHLMLATGMPMLLAAINSCPRGTTMHLLCWSTMCLQLCATQCLRVGWSL